MSQAASEFDELDEILSQLTEQDPDPLLRPRLNQLLDGNPRAQRRYLEHQLLHADLLDPSGPLLQFEHSHGGKQPGGVMQQAQPDWIQQYEEDMRNSAKARPGRRSDKYTITPHQLLALTGFVLGKALTSKPAYKAYAIAAMCLIAATLFAVFSDADQTSPDPIAGPMAGQVPAAKSQVDPPHSAPASVATLTATQNAVWSSPQAEGASAPGSHLSVGSPLHPNQRLTLTQGFAEITTNRGAIAILEAPATIELTHNDNALRLHSGKLVGICETESSKGFLVRTPHMDITDLGTRFGVAADGHASAVSVFQGRVQAVQSGSQTDNTGANPVLLKRNEAASAKIGQGVQRLASTAATHQQFASLRSEIFSRQARVYGDIRILYHPPASIDRGQSADTRSLQLFRERSGVTLDDALQIDTAGTGSFNSYHSELQPQTLQGGRVTSYMLFASRDYDGGTPEADIIQLSGSVTFEGRIVGLIGRSESLQQSDVRLGLTEVDYGNHIARGILKEKAAFVDDRIEISQDRKTLTIDCKFVGIDQLRILVEHP